MYERFIDLKAAFDKVDRKILWKAMEERSIRRGLIERVKEIYEQTKNAVRVYGNITDWFWTRKGVRISPKPATLWPCNSRCEGGDEERTSRWSIDKKRH